MTPRDEIVNPDERIVKVRSKVRGTFYTIRDVFLGYWRSTEPLDGYAWTRDLGLRAEFWCIGSFGSSTTGRSLMAWSYTTSTATTRTTGFKTSSWSRPSSTGASMPDTSSATASGTSDAAHAARSSR